VWIAFYVYFWSKQGQTLGMRAWRLAVADENGYPIGGKRALLRWFCALITCAPAGIGLWWRALDKDGRTLYDRLSRTRLYLLPGNPYPSPKKKRKNHV
jgi:protein-export membrane protein secF